MKNLIFILLTFLAFTGCTSSSTNNGADTALTDTLVSDDTVSASINGCYLYTEGAEHTDSTKVWLKIEGNTVSGKIDWIPFEKDGRKGTVEGTKNGKTLNVVWAFSQEGMQDTMALDFEIDGSKLRQKPLKANNQTGRQQTDANAAYSLIYNEIDCGRIGY